MNYNVVTRPKLPRNKYGDVNNTSNSIGTVYFSNDKSSASSSNNGSDIKDFIGSTSTNNGVHGLVPAPKSNINEVSGTLNDNVKFLKGNGTWTDIPISRYTEENNNADGIKLNGNLSITDTLSTETLNVTGSAHFWELVIDKVRSTNGNLLITPANFTVDYVGDTVVYSVDETQSPYTELFAGISGLSTLFTSVGLSHLIARRVYMRKYSSGKQISNDFIIGDMVRCKTFNIEQSTYTSNKDYWTFVLGVGETTYNDQLCNYIDVLNTYMVNSEIYTLGTTIISNGNSFKFGYGTIDIEEGDNLVSLGHLWDSDRESAIIISACDPLDTELSTPSIAQYNGINKFENLSQFRTNSIAANGNEFIGRFNVNYNGNYIDINERINIFASDLNTGLESVGIHLDGENSSIKLIGSVEIHQNSDTDIDTLTVWDSDDIIRVQISPEEIPAKSEISTSINPTTSKVFKTLNGFEEANGSVSTTGSYRYYLSNAYFNFTTTSVLGNFNAGDTITIDDIWCNIYTTAYFKGSTYTSNRTGVGESQNISSIIIRLQKNESNTWSTVSTYNISSDATIRVNSEVVNINYNNVLINDLSLPSTASYRLELSVVFNVCASITYPESQSDPSFKFQYSVTSGCKMIFPSTAMTRIGANGILYNTSNVGEYFYSGSDGIEAKWGDSFISIDDDYGVKISGLYQTISSSSTNYISSKTTIADASSFTENTTIYLPSASTYGVGRVLTVLGNDYISINTINSQTIRVPITEETAYSTIPIKSNLFNSISSLSLTEETSSVDPTNTENTIYKRTHSPVVKLMSTGSDWIKL